MSKFSINALPEVFVSNAAITKAVSAAVSRGKLRQIGTRLYTRNFDEEPERLVKRHWHALITEYFPDALITDRTGLENQPASDGSVCLISTKKRDVALPGIVFRPRPGPGPLESDKPFLGGAHLVSTARAYLENLRHSRRSKYVARTLSRAEIEVRLEGLLRQNGERALNRIRDDARKIAPMLAMETEYEALSALIGTLLGTRQAEVESVLARARVAGKPFDPNRINLFEMLFATLRETVPSSRSTSGRTAETRTNLSFFDAYFSNFIEGTEFEIDEARDIVFEGKIPQQRPEDAHDVLGTFRVVSDAQSMKILPRDAEQLLDLLKRRHAAVMSARPDTQPGTFKDLANRAGGTIFVAPDLVLGTLERGFGLMQGLSEPFQRAVFIMVLISEVHPFVDGNGRVARIMMNAELMAADQERIIIPTAYRVDCLTALRALSRNRAPEPVIRMLDFAQRYTHAVDWSDLTEARQTLEATGALLDGDDARLCLPLR